MTKFDYRWMEDKKWIHQLEDGSFVVNDDAPNEVKESYQNYVKQHIDYAKRKKKYIERYSDN